MSTGFRHVKQWMWKSVLVAAVTFVDVGLLAAQKGLVCEIDSMRAEYLAKHYTDSVGLHLIEVIPQSDWKGVVIFSAITGEFHDDPVYIAVTCKDEVFELSQPTGGEYQRFIRSMFPYYTEDFPALEVFHGYARFVEHCFDQNVVTQAHIDSVVLETGYECVTLPEVKQRPTFIYPYVYQFFYYAGSHLFIRSVEFSFEKGFRYCSIRVY